MRKAHIQYNTKRCFDHLLKGEPSLAGGKRGDMGQDSPREGGRGWGGWGTSRKSGGKGFGASGTSPFFQVSVSMIKEMREGPKNLVYSARHLAPNSHGNNSEKQLELPRKEEEEGEML